MQKKIQDIRFIVLADHHTLLSSPWCAITKQEMDPMGYDQERLLKRPEYIRTQF